MGCLVLIFALISPRLAILAVWIFGDWLGQAYESWWLPFLGFFLLPWTTLTYAGMYVSGSNEVTDFEWFLVILAFLLDLASFAGGGRRYRD